METASIVRQHNSGWRNALAYTSLLLGLAGLALSIFMLTTGNAWATVGFALSVCAMIPGAWWLIGSKIDAKAYETFLEEEKQRNELLTVLDEEQSEPLRALGPFDPPLPVTRHTALVTIISALAAVSSAFVLAPSDNETTGTEETVAPTPTTTSKTPSPTPTTTTKTPTPTPTSSATPSPTPKTSEPAETRSEQQPERPEAPAPQEPENPAPAPQAPSPAPEQPREEAPAPLPAPAPPAPEPPAQPSPPRDNDSTWEDSTWNPDYPEFPAPEIPEIDFPFFDDPAADLADTVADPVVTP